VIIQLIIDFGVNSYSVIDGRFGCFLLDGTDHDDNTCIGLIMSELIPVKERLVYFGEWRGNSEINTTTTGSWEDYKQSPSFVQEYKHHCSQYCQVESFNLNRTNMLLMGKLVNTLYLDVTR